MRALSSSTALRIATAITVYCVTVNLLVFFLEERNLPLPEAIELAPVFIADTFFLLIPVRWVLLLVEIVRSVRARPLKLLAFIPRLQIGIAIAIHALMGLVSLIAWLTVWLETSPRGDRVMGLILQALLPSAAIVWLYRRGRLPATRAQTPT